MFLVVTVSVVAIIVAVAVVVGACYWFSPPASVIRVRGRLDASDPGTCRENEEVANRSDEWTTLVW